MGFTDLKKGVPDWHEKYNEDFRAFETQLSNKVNKAIPTMYQLSFVQGVTGRINAANSYSKNQFSEVQVHFVCDKADGQCFALGEQHITTLPVGFYPCEDKLTYFTTLTHGDNDLPAGYGYVNKGAIYVWCNSPSIKTIMGSAAFMALP